MMYRLHIFVYSEILTIIYTLMYFSLMVIDIDDQTLVHNYSLHLVVMVITITYVVIINIIIFIANVVVMAIITFEMEGELSYFI